MSTITIETVNESGAVEETEVVEDTQFEELVALAKAERPHLEDWMIRGAVRMYLDGTLPEGAQAQEGK